MVDLMPLPFVAAELAQVAADGMSDARQMASTIQRDPALTARVLRMANSAFFTGRGRVQTVSEAAVRLGTRELRQMALAISVVQSHDGAGKELPLDAVGLWKHSLGCAVVARELASAGGRAAPESAFLAGLLHDVGKMLFNEHFGREYVDVLAAARKGSTALHSHETDRLTLNHAEAAGPLLERWRLPAPLADPILHHHRSWEALRAEAGEGRDPAVTYLVKLADVLAKACGVGDGGDGTLEYVPQEAWDRCGVRFEILWKTLGELDAKVSELAQIFLLHGGSTGAPVRARPVGAGVRVTFVRPDDRATAVRALLQRAGCTILVEDELERALAGDGPALVGPVEPAEAAALVERVARASPRGTSVLLVAAPAEPGLKERLKECGGRLLQSPWSMRRLLRALGGGKMAP